MANTDSEISRNIAAIRSAVYGKDIRKAIADGIQKCYDYVTESSASTAIERAREAINELTLLVDQSAEVMATLHESIEETENVVVVSEDQPTSPENKIWIKPQPDTEYRIANYEAYSVLWDYVNDLNETYNSGHGGIVSIVQDEQYIDESETDIPDAGRRIRKYVITYADGTQSDFVIRNAVGPIDTLQENGVVIEYAKGVIDNGAFVKTPPADDQWSETLPDLSPGDYLWTRTKNVYRSGNVSTSYSVSAIGENGIDGVKSIKLGEDGEIMIGDVVIPFDTDPTEGHSGSLVSSGGVWSAIEDLKDSPHFTGTPTAPTPTDDSDNSQIATVEYVRKTMVDFNMGIEGLFDSPELTGSPTAPTPDINDDSDAIATTKFAGNYAKYYADKILRDYFAYPFFGIYHETITGLSVNGENFRYIDAPNGSSHLIAISTVLPSKLNAVFILTQPLDPNEDFSLQILSQGSNISLNRLTSSIQVVFDHAGSAQLGSYNRADVLDIILYASSGIANSSRIQISSTHN